jgi:Tat protein secretion system quality control protein TatD with DNase activity
MRWLASRKSWRWASAGWISTATFPRLRSKKAFSAQLALAAELSMPVFLHCRDAHERFLALLVPWLDKLPGAVLHCFTGSREEMRECVEHGLFIGITGWVCDERRGWSCESCWSIFRQNAC